MKGTKSTHQCPICATPLEYFSRYPNYVCINCMAKVSDSAGRKVKFSNIGVYGGISGRYVDDNSAYEHQECFIDGKKCFANDAHTGGIVIESYDFHEQLRSESNLDEKRFTLIRNAWYAAEIIGDEFSPEIRSYSPIKILGLERKKTGESLFTLHFYHANYPAGVNNKTYELQTIERALSFILARTPDTKKTRYLLIYSIDEEWLSRHFDVKLDRSSSVEDWLNKNA